MHCAHVGWGLAVAFVSTSCAPMIRDCVRQLSLVDLEGGAPLVGGISTASDANETGVCRYSSVDDAVVVDTNTGLMWQASVSARGDFLAARQVCDQLELGGFDNWRLPTSDELRRLRAASTIEEGGAALFPRVDGANWWAQTYAYVDGYAWATQYGTDTTSVNLQTIVPTYQNAPIRCVRRYS